MLELGAGMSGMAGIAAAVHGGAASVLITDGNPDCVASAFRPCIRGRLPDGPVLISRLHFIASLSAPDITATVALNADLLGACPVTARQLLWQLDPAHEDDNITCDVVVMADWYGNLRAEIDLYRFLFPPLFHCNYFARTVSSWLRRTERC